MLLTLLHRADRFLARILFFREHPKDIPLLIHDNGDACPNPVDCTRRHW